MEEDKRVDLKVYDVPVELKNQYISMAKLDYDNELWKVLEAGMEKLQDERQNKIPEMEEKVMALQKQIAELKLRMDNMEDVDEDFSGPKTFGRETEKTKDKDDDELLSRFS